MQSNPKHPTVPPWNEADRLAALDRYAILDTPAEPAFDDIARLIGDIFDAPIAVVNLIASGRQWFKAEMGIGVRELSLDVSICAHAILQSEIFVIPDTMLDDRFRNNPLVTASEGLRFYAGALLMSAEGLPIGTLCVLDRKPRPEGITDSQRMALDVLSRQVMAQLDLRREVRDRDRRAHLLEQEIAEKAAAVSALGESRERYNTLFNSIDAGFCVIEMAFDDDRRPIDYRFVEVNAAFEEQTGLADAAGQWMRDVAPDHEQYWFDLYGRVALSGESARFENPATALDGRWYDIHAFRIGPAEGRQVAILFSDITGRRLSESGLRELNETLERRIGEAVAAHEQTQEALRQAQKMEAVGQLTGGIAHDFNNMLTGVIGSLDLVQRYRASGRAEKVDRYIEAATTSAQRAAALTARLLAFGRRQSLDLQPTDVDDLVRGMADLLKRTLGEHIRFDVKLATAQWHACTDTNQLENALLNLCINARDAMPDGGHLIVETAAAAIAADNADVPPGDYVVLSVSDTGQGMSADTMGKVFEPFFTTKPVGQGTGLGLSMIYGFATQSGGHVRLASELGEGTTVRLFLPRFEGEAEEPSVDAIVTPRGQGETVLVVEDDPSVRLIILDVLEELGYAALEAVDGHAALPIIESGRRIDLLISDVGLPGINGRQLAEIARQRRPDLHVLFITGYAENAAVRGDFLDRGMEILAKPFAIEALATRIRQIIGG